MKEVRLLKHDYDETAPFNYTILADRRDELMVYLEGKGVGTVINYIPNHDQPLFGGTRTNLPNTEKAYKDMVSIPMHAGLSDEDARTVVDAITDFYPATAIERTGRDVA